MNHSSSHKKSTSKGFYIFLTTSIILLLVMIVFLLGIVFVPGFTNWTRDIPVLKEITKVFVGDYYAASEKEAQTTEKVVTTQDATTQQEVEKETMLAEHKKVDPSYLDEAVFLGDSRTVAMVKNGWIKEENSLAIVGLCHVNAISTRYTFETTGATCTMQDYLMEHNGKMIYISYGINGIGYTQDSVYREKYQELLDYIAEYAPDSILVLQSIWPVKEGYRMTSKITNEQVDEYNDFLFQEAKERGIYYLDTESVLKDTYNSMKYEYNNGDGLHYNQEAYDAVFDYILTHPVPEYLE